MKHLFHFTAAVVMCITMPLCTRAQNLVKDGDIKRSSPYWKSDCVRVEDYQNETAYGGADARNEVAEIDDETCMHQDIPTAPGGTYKLALEASRRTIAPNPCTTTITVSGLDKDGMVVATLVHTDFKRTNETFALTEVKGIPLIRVPRDMRIKMIRVNFEDNTPGFSGLGMIVDNISLTRAGSWDDERPGLRAQPVENERYKIIHALSIREMEQQVSEALNDDWRLYGELIIEHEPEKSYYQAVTR